MRKELIMARSQIVKLIRRYFDERGFIEMQTPRLVGLPGQEPYLEPFWTSVIEQDGNVHPAGLVTSPEYAMKRLLAEGFERIYDLGPCFRNGEPWDGSHDPEFLLLEWYRRDAGLTELMADTAGLIAWVSRQFLPAEDVRLKCLTQAFRRLTVCQAMKEYAGVELEPLLADRSKLAEIAKAHGQTVSADDNWDDVFFKIFLTEVEPKLGWTNDHQWQPTFLWNYPASMAALARRNPDDPRFALRTELYIGDLELANGFAELADADEQRTRFIEERQLRQNLGKSTWALDERFLACLPAMGNAAGIAFGVERLAMLLAGAASLADLLPIPVRERFTS